MTDQRRGARLKSATLTDRLGSAAGIAVSVVVVRFQLDFDSTGVRRAFDCLSKVIEISDTYTPHPTPLRWWSCLLLFYVRVILVIGIGTQALLFTFITYITQYTSHGSRRHTSIQDQQRRCCTQMLPRHTDAAQSLA